MNGLQLMLKALAAASLVGLVVFGLHAHGRRVSALAGASATVAKMLGLDGMVRWR